MSETQEYVTYTIEEVFNALAQDGFEHLRHEWTSQDMDGVINGGCVLAQTAFNLGVLAAYDEDQNEFHEYSLVRQLNQFTVDSENKWAIDGYAGAGETIVNWNDRESNSRSLREYTLKTYADVVAMAKDVLSPHFDKTIRLAKYQWNLPEVTSHE